MGRGCRTRRALRPPRIALALLAPDCLYPTGPSRVMEQLGPARAPKSRRLEWGPLSGVVVTLPARVLSDWTTGQSSGKLQPPTAQQTSPAPHKLHPSPSHAAWLLPPCRHGCGQGVAFAARAGHPHLDPGLRPGDIHRDRPWPHRNAAALRAAVMQLGPA